MISNAIAERGYELASSPKSAGDIIQVNILSCEMTNPSAIEKTLGYGYGGTIGAGILTGAFIGIAMRSDYGMAQQGAPPEALRRVLLKWLRAVL